MSTHNPFELYHASADKLRERTNFSKKAWRTLIAGSLLAPALLWIFVYKIGTVLYNIYLSFHEVSYTGEMEFVGLSNYLYILEDPVLVRTLFNTIILFGTIPVAVAIALAIALLLNRDFIGNYAFRSLFFLPYITMMVAVAVIWNYMFHTEEGVINYMLLEAGLISTEISWFGDSLWALVAVFLVQVWKTVGFYVVVILAGLQTIPQQVYEVSRIDGANSLQQFRYLTLPLLKPTLGVCLLVGVALTFRVFDLIRVLTRGGPNYGTEHLLTWIYKQAYSYGEIGYAAVLSVLMVVITVGIAFLGLHMQRRTYQ